MENIHKKLIISFAIIVIAKILFSLLIPTLSIFADEYVYAKNARSFHNGEGIHVHGEYDKGYPPLYSMVISIAYSFRDMELAYIIMKIINSILTGLIIFPAYFLSKEFLNDKDSLITSILVAILPTNVGLNYYIMGENLFYPLFLTYIYLFYQALKTSRKLYFILTGIIIGLSLLTKTLAFVIIPITILTLIINNIRKINKKQIKNTIISLIIAGLIYLPYLIYKRNITSEFSIIPGYEIMIQPEVLAKFDPVSILIWIIFYSAIIILSTGIVSTITTIPNLREIIKKYKLMSVLFGVSIFSALAVASYYASQTGVKPESIIPFLKGRAIGRYLNYILPLVIISAIISIKNFKKRLTVKNSIFVGTILTISAPVVFFSLFPINNLSTSWIGTIKYILNTINIQNRFIILLTFIAIFILLTILSHKIINKNKAIQYLFIFFITINLLNLTLISYNSHNFWNNSEQTELGKWINKNIKEDSIFLIDNKYCIAKDLKKTEENLGPYPGCKWTKPGFWINSNIIIDSLNTKREYNYIITKEELNENLIKKIGTTYLYKKA